MAMSASSASLLGSGLLHGWIKGSDGTIHDIEAIVSGGGDTAMDSVEIPGDDVLKATFNSNQKVELSIKANAFSFDAYTAITGNPVTNVAAVTGTGAHAFYKHTPG